MKREIIVIDEEKCNGFGLCITGCHEGALQIIDEKARLISDLFCDGLGACIGHCPEGALTIEEREAAPYDEVKVMEIMVTKGENTLRAHLRHLQDHGEHEFLTQGINYLKTINHPMDLHEFEDKTQTPLQIVEELFGSVARSGLPHSGVMGGCPGAQPREFNIDKEEVGKAGQQAGGEMESALRQWPVQLHLLNPEAGYFKNADVVLTADCVAYSMADFHRRFLHGRSLAIACPKLDSNLDSYVDKLTAMISDARINTLSILRMEVPCCGGLVQMARMASMNASRKVPLKEIVVGVRGNIISEEWI